jgi:hypothetical protein
MQAVATAAASAQSLGEPMDPSARPTPETPPQPRRPSQLLRNYVPWPSTPSLSRDERDQLSASLYIEALSLPASLESYKSVTLPGPPIYPYLVARSLTALRHRLTQETDARVCIGGKEKKYTGRYPGIVEEALFAVIAHQPVYLVGAFGGATQWVIDALEGRRTKPFDRDNEMTKLYSQHSVESSGESASDQHIDTEQARSEFESLKTDGLAELNGLTSSENRELFATSVIPMAIELVVTGLGRLRRNGRLSR